jgi:peptidoglycan hydrolase CwlO-like protein
MVFRSLPMFASLTPRKLFLIGAAVLLSAVGLWAALPLGAGAQSEGDLRDRIDKSKGSEQQLAADAETFGRLERKLAAQVAVLQGKLDAVQEELDGRLAQLARTRAGLARQRRRHAALLVRLETSRDVLATRLSELYRQGDTDTMTFLLGASNFTDLIDRSEFLSRVNRQDTRIIIRVGSARDDARVSAGRLRKLTGKQRKAAGLVRERRDAMATMREALAARQASFAEAKQARLAALGNARSNRKKLEGELDKLIEEQRKAANATPPSSGIPTAPGNSLGPNGGWAIPWAIVQCESGGQNFPPNWATASGYYQIITSTWDLFGGKEFAPQAYLASKAQQDIVASRIYNGGAGIGNWDCAVLLDLI